MAEPMDILIQPVIFGLDVKFVNGTTVELYIPRDPEFTLDTSLVVGLPGPPGAPGSSGPPYEHTQSSPSAEWIVNHNYGYNPTVAILNSAGQEIEATVIHMSLNQTRVFFNQPITGKAIAR